MNLFKLIALTSSILYFSCNNDLNANSKGAPKDQNGNIENETKSPESEGSYKRCYQLKDDSQTKLCLHDSINYIIFMIEHNQNGNRIIYNGVAKYMGDFNLHIKASNGFYENPEDNNNPFPVDQFEGQDSSYIYNIGLSWNDASKVMFTIYSSNDPEKIIYKTNKVLHLIK